MNTKFEKTVSKTLMWVAGIELGLLAIAYALSYIFKVDWVTLTGEPYKYLTLPILTTISNEVILGVVLFAITAGLILFYTSRVKNGTFKYLNEKHDMHIVLKMIWFISIGLLFAQYAVTLVNALLPAHSGVIESPAYTFMNFLNISLVAFIIAETVSINSSKKLETTE